MDLSKRYDRNGTTVSANDSKILHDSKVCIVGCGGLGGYIIEMLSRIGVGHLICVDGDVFDVTNLNRQLLSNEENVGKQKAFVAKEHVEKINSETEVTAIYDFFTEENGEEILKDCNLIFDALDNINSRRCLQNIAAKMGIPIVHGAIAGWCGQLSVIYPGDGGFNKIFPEDINKGAEVETGNPAFTPATIAAMEVAEGIKVLLSKEEEVLRNKLLTVDLLYHEYEVTEL